MISATALAVISCWAAKSLPLRVLISVVSILTIGGAPWVLSPVIGGVAWVIAAGRERRRTLWGKGFDVRGLSAGLLLGGILGSVAIPFVRLQVSSSPIIIDFPRPPMLQVSVMLVVLALANALGEELVWRGALLSEGRHLHPVSQCAIQAISFGVAHFHGLPGGLAGVILAGTAGAILFLIRRRWGFMSALGAHFVADILIFTSILPWVYFSEVWVF